MINEERVIINGDVNIGATIAYQDQDKKRPLVLLIMGTGSLNRDGNGLGIKSNIYKDLSDMFVDMGCVCIRYDKRGTHESTGDAKTCGLSDLVNDAANVIHYAKKLDYVNKEKIVVCGHSEGAMVATLLTKNEELEGIILLGGACMGLKDAMLYQNYLVVEEVNNMKGILGWYLIKLIKEETIEKQVLGIFKKAESSKKDTYFYRGTFLPTKYMKEHYALNSEDYIKLLKAYKGQILAITGKADVQADYTKLEDISNLDNVTIYTPINVNHLMKEIDGDTSILNIKKEYKKLFKKEIAKGVKDKIKDFISKI